MNGQLFAELVIAGLGTGAIYSMIAMGYNIIFATSGVLNFAQGEFYMLGTMIGVLLYVSVGLPAVVALVATIAVVALLAALEHPLAVRPASRSGEGAFGWVIATFGFSIVLSSATAMLMGAKLRPFPEIIDLGRWDIGGVVVDGYRMSMIVVACVTALALGQWLSRSSVGQALNAIHEDPEAAQFRGIPVSRLATLSFAVGGAIVAMIGFMSAPLTTASATVGLTMGLKGFIAAALGGIPSIKGALVGGLLLGLVETFSTHVAGGGFRNVSIFAVLVIVLAVRPVGIFGRGSVRAV